jgi:small subunit ribosomal protein S16
VRQYPEALVCRASIAAAPRCGPVPTGVRTTLTERKHHPVAVKIRLMRVGKKKQPTYRVVVADGRSPRDGRFIEIIGKYAPRQEPSFIDIDGEKALAWLAQGAQPTEQVQKLLTATGVWEEFAKTKTDAGRKRLPKPKVAKTKVAASAPVTEDIPPVTPIADSAPAAAAPAAAEPEAAEPEAAEPEAAEATE